MPPDYSGQNLRGRSFKGQNLTGANFSKADIRGADFTNAILKNADFTGAKAGLQRRWVIGLLIVSWLLAAISGCGSIPLGMLITYIFDTNFTEKFLTGLLSVVAVAVFFVFAICKGLTAGLKFAVFSFVLTSGLGNVFGGLGALYFARTQPTATWGEFAFILSTFRRVAQAFALAEAGVVAVVITFAVAFVFIEFRAVAGGIVGAGTGVFAFLTEGIFVEFGAVVFALAFILPNAYIGWRSLAGNEKDAWVRSFALAFAATGGTSFRNADLTDADFTGATLKNTDFRKANLRRTRFYEAKKLDFARVEDTILTKLTVLKLLVTGNGRGKSYAGADFKGANLIGADLNEANLKGADISKATFQGACLEKANLTFTQAVDTDFTSAQMTGACVEAWNIESTTKLNNVDCRFVYLLEDPKPGTDDRERRPSSGEFQPGEFTKLFEEVLNTVDLIFRDGIDWKAFVNAFKNVQVENQDTELAIQSIGNKGDGFVVVKLDVPLDADKEKIHSDFTNNYQLALQAVEEKYKAQLQAKDEQIVIYRQQSGDMKEIISLLANKPINVQVDNKLENKNMTNSNDSSSKIDIGGIGNNAGRDVTIGDGALNFGEISGGVTKTINELPTSPEPEKPGIKELLTQLQTAIEADTNLNEEDKAEALEQVKALAEAGKNPKEGAMQKSAKTAMKILKGTISSLPSAATLVEECGKVLPLISGFLGLG